MTARRRGSGALGDRVWLSWLGVAALAVAVVLVGLATVDRWRDGESNDAELPVAVAESAARSFFTLDHRTADDDIDRVLASATGEFREQYETQSAELRTTVTEKKLVISAEIPEEGTAVEHVADDELWVLVPVDVHTEQRGEATDDVRYRTRVVLARTDEGWLVSRLEQVG